MKKVWLLVLISLVFAFPMSAAFAAETPTELVRNTTDEVITRIENDREELRQDPAKMFALVSELIFPRFDFPIMAQWVLGTHWKGADPQSQQLFIDQFRKLLVRTYATALLEFSDQAITYPDKEATRKGRTAVVRQEIEQAGSAPIALGYRLHDGSGQWKVIDVSVDGVSLVKTYRASFSSMINESGLASLIETLRAKNKEINQ
ncbi:MAG: phospholipid transport system substrate-binding protein [Gammaproteobacteria bacterium]|jgi:phospholipid transport system substrate-binding protein